MAVAEPLLPTRQDVVAAARRLGRQVRRTPLLEDPRLNRRLGGRVLLKAECLQRTGSFKIRGALNAILQIPPEQRGRGVIAFSSGNHAQGVAAAASLLGLPATIVMPADAPMAKRSGTISHGARVRLYDRYREERERIAARLAAESGATLVKPYDDRHVIAGQGTVGLELLEQLPATPDALLVPCGGGGLAAGIALALADQLPERSIHPVEPVGYEDTARSLAAGRRVANAPAPPALCDALQAPTPGEITFAVNRRHLGRGLAVGDRHVLDAMRVAFDVLRLVVEPGGAVALGALLAGGLDVDGRTVVVVLSGGNVDAELFGRALTTVEG